MNVGKTQLVRKPGESGRSFLSRRLIELRDLKETLTGKNWSDDEEKAYYYCDVMIPEIEADLKYKTDECLDKHVTWELSGNMGKCPLLVDHLPSLEEPEPPTRAMRGLEALPCKYTDCPEYGTELCWAWQTDKEPVAEVYGVYPIE